MYNDALILVFISNNPPSKLSWWQTLAAEYQCVFTDSIHFIELHNPKKNGGFYHRGRK